MKGKKGFQKGVVTNPNGRKGVGDKNKQKIRDAIQNILEDNIDKVFEELSTLTGKDFLDMYSRFLEYSLPKLQRQTIEIDTEKVIRTFNFIPASEIVPEKEPTNGENKE